MFTYIFRNYKNKLQTFFLNNDSSIQIKLNQFKFYYFNRIFYSYSRYPEVKTEKRLANIIIRILKYDTD